MRACRIRPPAPQSASACSSGQVVFLVVPLAARILFLVLAVRIVLLLAVDPVVLLFHRIVGCLTGWRVVQIEVREGGQTLQERGIVLDELRRLPGAAAPIEREEES